VIGYAFVGLGMDRLDREFHDTMQPQRTQLCKT